MKLSHAPRFTTLGLLAVSTSALFLTLDAHAAKPKKGELTGAYNSGNIAAALVSVEKETSARDDNKNGILTSLEHGATLRTAALTDPGQVPAISRPVAPPQNGEAPAPVTEPTPEEVTAAYLVRSIAAFDTAEAKVNDFEEGAKIKAGSEVAAALTNLGALPYRGHAYDKVMMNTYKAINYLQLGQKDNARVELNRALQRQRDAVEQNAKHIAEAQETAEKAKKGEIQDEKGKSAAYDVEQGQNDPKTGPALTGVLTESTANMKVYGDYVNPFSVFLDGLFFATLGENGADWERARKSMERVAQMSPDNPYAKEDFLLASAVAEGKSAENLTYVIFETGAGPYRDEIKIDIPTFLVTSKLAYVGAAFPKLKFNNDFLGALSVKAGDQTLTTSTLASIDSVVAHDFKNEWPTIVTKTMVTTATKAIVQATLQKQAGDRLGFAAGLAAKVAITAANAATTHADKRVWSTLPKEIQYARLTTPADRNLLISAGGTNRTVTLLPGSINVVYVKSVSSSAPLFVSQFILK